ncbi:four helix bundle protein [candidate division WOR-3 bacterium]|nr:four helix bundle protein [candidate division WOR-3 bacterium]
MKKATSTFEDLEVWQRGRELRREISNLAKTFPKEESYLLTNQMIRASRSVTANISEGYGRFHYQENIQFCRQSRGSLFELLDHLTVALDEKYIDENKFIEFKEQIFEVIRMLNGYIKYLSRRKNKND